MKEVVQQLNDLKIVQKSGDFLEDLPEDIYEKYFLNCEDENLYVVKHRWYETSISVYTTDKGYLGVRSVTDTFSEQMEIGDIFYTLKFFEMEPIITTTYKIKK